MRDKPDDFEALIASFDRQWDRSAFNCGSAILNDWLKRQAGQQEKSGNARTFLAVEPASGRVVGYYATTAYRLDLDEVSVALGVGKRRYPIPAVLLARLAVDAERQGRGLGRQLLSHALRNIAQASNMVGFVVHAIDQEAAAFYSRYGFVPFADHPQRLFLTINHVRATLAAES